MANRAYNILNDDDLDIIVDPVKGIGFGDETGHLQEKLLLLNPGDLKHEPETGVGIADYLLEDGSMLELQREVQKQFELDGMVIESMDLTKSTIIRARYDSKS